MTTYTEPVSRLLSYGDTVKATEGWPDYVRELGLDAGHVEQLIAMVTDPALNTADSESLEVWAPMHAWRALGQLGSVEAVQPLLALLEQYPEDDWLHDELPDVFALIGEPAIEPLAAYLMESAHDEILRADAARSLRLIAEEHEHCRERCVTAIVQQLGGYADNPPVLNGFLVSNLIDLDATAHIDLIEEAYAADAVDLSICGDFEDVQLELGLIDERRTPRPRLFSLPGFPPNNPASSPVHSPPGSPIVKGPKVGRNDPCPCGSGKKYKKCCLLKQ